MFSNSITAQEKVNEQAVKKTIETFLEALHKGDNTIMKTTLHREVKIQRISTNKEGVKILKTDSLQKLLTFIANKKLEYIYLEKLISIDIKIDGNLASV